MVVSLRLAKAGYWGGDPGAVLRAPADEVMAAIQFERFQQEYEAAYIDLNREGK